MAFKVVMSLSMKIIDNGKELKHIPLADNALAFGIGKHIS